MDIRRATEQDLLKAGRLWIRMVAETMPDATPNVVWWRDQTFSMMRIGSYFMFVAEEGGRMAGFASFTIGPSAATGKIAATAQHIYVDPEYRSKKIGFELHMACRRLAIHLGAETWNLLCAKKEKNMWMRKGFSEFQTLMTNDKL